MATCHMCPDGSRHVADDDVIEHLRVLHPDQYELLERWLDGAVVIYDTTLEPGDFGGEH